MEPLQDAPGKWAQTTDDGRQVVENVDYFYAHNSSPKTDDKLSAVNKYK